MPQHKVYGRDFININSGFVKKSLVKKNHNFFMFRLFEATLEPIVTDGEIDASGVNNRISLGFLQYQKFSFCVYIYFAKEVPRKGYVKRVVFSVVRRLRSCFLTALWQGWAGKTFYPILPSFTYLFPIMT